MYVAASGESRGSGGRGEGERHKGQVNKRRTLVARGESQVRKDVWMGEREVRESKG